MDIATIDFTRQDIIIYDNGLGTEIILHIDNNEEFQVELINYPRTKNYLEEVYRRNFIDKEESDDVRFNGDFNLFNAEYRPSIAHIVFDGPGEIAHISMEHLLFLKNNEKYSQDSIDFINVLPTRYEPIQGTTLQIITD